MKWRVKKNFEEGLLWGANLYGYSVKDNVFNIIPNEAKIVKKIFDYYIDGKSIRGIAKKLNSEGIKTRLCNDWSDSSIRTILNNEYYTGNRILQKTYSENFLTKKDKKNNGELPKYFVEGAHPAIISIDEFNSVQNLLKLKRNKFYTNNNKPVKSPFSRMVICDNCGSTLRRKTTNKIHYFLCGNLIDNGLSACPSKQVPETILYEKTNKLLGMKEYDEVLFHEKILKIVAKNDKTLTYIFRDGKTKEVKWDYKSRSHSWTKEMKEKARIAALKKYGGDDKCQK